MEKKYTYEDFLEIIRALRSENGCPWDREQTHQSLRPCLMEEAAEVIAAIRIFDQTGNPANLKEELGDVLLQVVMHAQIAAEEGLFSMEDVVQDVAEKMVRRHPHVFGDVEASTSGQVLENWEEIKKKEKEKQAWVESPLREVPPELPALTRAPKVLKKADKHYGYRSTYEEDMDKLEQALHQLRAQTPKEYDEEIEKQVGNILMAVSDISRLCKLSQEQILTDKIADLIELCEGKAEK
ncbi:MAG: nucleoside triphosphate pyrophosphohydrolase [Lachnospiraceae bacterium]|nr:nucleoside triphosphate pyrophosphohydrolase [Lachnospiraceae bacterium]